MNTRTIRLGIFSRRTAPSEGGADTLANTLRHEATALQSELPIELVPVPWQAWSQRRNPLRFVWVRVARRLGIEVPEVDLRPVCRRFELDLAYLAGPAFVRLDVPFIFTLWDLGHRTIPEFPEMRSARVPWTQREALCRQMLAQASYVVVGNEAGAAEVRESFGLRAERVIPIPFPNPDFADVEEAPVGWLPARDFFLYPAQLWPHKNHFTLLRALAFLAAQRRTVPDLVFVGSDQGNARYLKTAAKEMGVADRVHFAGFVARGELKTLYRRATGLVFPSLLGPNNLPPQEAAVLGCPPIVSDLAGHREQMGDGALYVAPLDAGGWADAMHLLLSGPAVRDRLRERARNAVEGYTIASYSQRLGGLFARLAAQRLLWQR